jgi:enoyl-CoA hydratase/carnithine racemase
LPPASAEAFIDAGGADAVTLIVPNRPASRNLSEAMLGELIEAFAAIGSDRSLRAVVLAAEGRPSVPGTNLKEFTARRSDPAGGRAFFDAVWAKCSTMMQAVVRLPQPVIACVQGAATAAGCQVLAACDLAVAAESATFATPGVNIGLFCSTPIVALSRNVAPKHAMEMLLTGDAISAEEALRIGLVNRVVPAAAARAEAMALAHRICAIPAPPAKTKRPLVLTVNGKAAAVVQDAEAYQHLLDLAAEASAPRASGRALTTWPVAGPGQRARCSTRSAPKMIYCVELTMPVSRNVRRIVRQINAESSPRAFPWFNEIGAGIPGVDAAPEGNMGMRRNGPAKPRFSQWLLIRAEQFRPVAPVVLSSPIQESMRLV